MIRRKAASSSTEPATGERRAVSPVNGERDANGSATAKRSANDERRSGIAMTPGQLSARRSPPFFEGPAPTLVVLAVLLSLSVLFLVLGVSRPQQRYVTRANAYQQIGDFAYSAVAKKASVVYPTGKVETGQPIYPSLVATVNLQFLYKFASAFPHHISGTVELRALLLSQVNTWQELSVIKAPIAFTGDSTSLSTPFPISSLYTLTNSVSAESGVTGATYSVEMEPVINIVGEVDGKPIKETFSPVLPFEVTPTSVTVVAAVTPAPAGATYVAPTAASSLAATLHSVEAGSIPVLVPNVVSVAKYHLKVPLLIRIGLVLGGLALLDAALHDVVRRRKTEVSEEELIARRFDTPLVPVRSLATPEGSTPLEVPDFTKLAGLAQFLERPILYEMTNGQRSYAVDDETRRYLYRPPDEIDAGPPSAAIPARLRE
jgi:hypothetical protein